MLRLAPEITTVCLDTEDIKSQPSSEIVFKGKPTGRRVEGAVLATAVQWKSFYLILMRYDNVLEESLRLYFLDDRFNLLDSALMNIPYCNGSFSLQEPNTVGFDFDDEDTWQVKLLPHRSFRVPLMMAYGIWPDPLFSRHFVIKKVVKPRPYDRFRSAIQWTVGLNLLLALVALPQFLTAMLLVASIIPFGRILSKVPRGENPGKLAAIFLFIALSISAFSIKNIFEPSI